ncbi:MAG: hypothetical protein ACRCSP_02325, partial [Rhodoglobus sp.]
MVEWGAVVLVFQTAQTQQLVDFVPPAQVKAEEVAGDVVRVAKALEGYVEAMGPVVKEFGLLRERARELGVKVSGFEPGWVTSVFFIPVWGESWDQDKVLVDENNGIREGIAKQVLLWQEAERECVNAIRAVDWRAPLHAGWDPKDPLGYGWAEIPGEADMPWGEKVTVSESWQGKVQLFGAHFVWDGVVMNLGVDTWSGLTSLTGWDGVSWPPALWEAAADAVSIVQGKGDGSVPDSMMEMGETMVQAWSGLGLVALGLVVPPPVQWGVGAVDDLVEGGVVDLDRVPVGGGDVIDLGFLDDPVETALGSVNVFDVVTDVNDAVVGGQRQLVAGFVGAGEWLNGENGSEGWKFFAEGHVVAVDEQTTEDVIRLGEDVITGKPWAENPGGSIGTGVANVGSLFIPGVGETRLGTVLLGAGAKSGGGLLDDVLRGGGRLVDGVPHVPGVGGVVPGVPGVGPVVADRFSLDREAFR